MPPAEGSFRYLGERERYAGTFFKLTTGTFLDPAGFTFERDIVRHPGAVVIVGLVGDEGVLMVRQYRGSVDRFVLELPAGKLDVPGEATEDAARRELIEETGYGASSMLELGRFFNSPGFTDEETTCFLAEGLEAVGPEHHGVEEEHMSVETVQLGEVWDLQQRGALVDAKSLIALGLAERQLASRRSVS